MINHILFTQSDPQTFNTYIQCENEWLTVWSSESYLITAVGIRVVASAESHMKGIE